MQRAGHSAAKLHPRPRVRLDLAAIQVALDNVERHWPAIDIELERSGIGRKDVFSEFLKDNMVAAYELLDDLVRRTVPPFSSDGIGQMLRLNNRVHYGTDRGLMAEFSSATEATATKFQENVVPIAAWYRKHAKRGDHPSKLAAETYVAILGRPQLFIEGNHRTGSLIASWINLDASLPPFVLTVDNAVAYFAPSAEIKRFADKSTWRGRRKLPKYRKAFREFWEQHVDDTFVLRG